MRTGPRLHKLVVVGLVQGDARWPVSIPPPPTHPAFLAKDRVVVIVERHKMRERIRIPAPANNAAYGNRSRELKLGKVHLAIQRRGAGVGQPRRLVDKGLADFEQDIVHATVVRLDLEWPRRFDALLRHVDDGGEDVRLGLCSRSSLVLRKKTQRERLHLPGRGGG